MDVQVADYEDAQRHMEMEKRKRALVNCSKVIDDLVEMTGIHNDFMQVLGGK